jgi:type II restriction enzyme
MNAPSKSLQRFLNQMPVNLDKPQLWKADIARSVDQYNEWFLKFAPATFRKTRVKVTQDVEAMLKRTNNLRTITSEELRNHPSLLFALRMSTAPPIARDRLVGLGNINKSLVSAMERKHAIPPRMPREQLDTELAKIVVLIMRLADVDIFPWLEAKRDPTAEEVYRGATIVADRLCGAQADPIVRNAQEQRQLAEIKRWLEARKYVDMTGKTNLASMRPGTFAARMIVPGRGLDENAETVNVPIDTAIMPHSAKAGDLPLLIEAKSAGDFTNVNKRRKEEATKVAMLRRKQGYGVRFVLFLCGYFDSGYLGYEASEGIDWVWEHRIDDLASFDL